jgi:uncharacterized membrane protein
MHIVLALIGALAGAAIGHDSGASLFDAIAGICAGLALGEVLVTRERLRAIETTLERLRAGKPEAAPGPRADATAHRPWADLEPSRSAAARTPASHARSPTVPISPAPSSAARPASPPTPTRSRPPTQPTTPTPTHAPPPRPAAAPSPAGEWPGFAALQSFFTSGNLLVRVGVLLLFFGIAFLLRYLAEHTRIPIELRLSGVAAAGLALLVLGWRLRRSRAGYALAVQGGGVGILYLTVFAALRLYDLLTPATAFPLLVAIAMLSAVLAVAQNSQAFAVLGVTGGFLAPILASTGHGSHVVLFSYYAVLDAGIIAVAWFKAWRPLNLVGFLFTFVIASVWGVLSYHAEDFATSEPFLVLFFALYVGIAVLFTLRQPLELAGYVDGTLVFGTPIAVFGLQAAMLHERKHALAASALAMGVAYLGVAALLFLRRRGSQRLLVECFIALGLAFLTLAVPLAFDPRVNAATWALEGAALIWLGCRQGRVLPRGAGLALLVAAGCVLAGEFHTQAGRFALPLDALWSVVTLTVAATYAAGLLQAQRALLQDFERPYSGLLFTWATTWWVVAGVTELDRWAPVSLVSGTQLVFLSLTALGASEIHRRLGIGVARNLSLLLLPVMLLFGLAAAESWHAPVDQGGWFAWPVAFSAFYVLVHRHEGADGSSLANALHVLGGWLLVALLSWQTAVTVGDYGPAAAVWTAIAWVLVPASVLLLLPVVAARIPWPFLRHRGAYGLASGGLALFVALWSFSTNVLESGDAAPLRYWPLLNPLDIAQGFALLALARHRGTLTPASSRWPTALLAALGFVWLNAVLLRTLHQWAGIPYEAGAMADSTLVQTSLSILWTIVAVATMRMAVHRRDRPAWLVAAALLAVVIAKLFLVDLSHSGSVERIVSFVGVALLIMAAGYFSPLPPSAEQRP